MSTVKPGFVLVPTTLYSIRGFFASNSITYKNRLFYFWALDPDNIPQTAQCYSPIQVNPPSSKKTWEFRVYDNSVKLVESCPGLKSLAVNITNKESNPPTLEVSNAPVVPKLTGPEQGEASALKYWKWEAELPANYNCRGYSFRVNLTAIQASSTTATQYAVDPEMIIGPGTHG